MSLLSEAELRERVERLAALERESGSEGEREAARLIASELDGLGYDVAVEPESVHGTYWWPIGLPDAAAALVGAAGGRRAAIVAGALAAASVGDDIRAGARPLRHLLPQRVTTNIVADAGDPSAEDVLVLVAHYDAAHSGLVFHPELARWPLRRFPKLVERARTTPPTMWGSVIGPALVAAGAALRSRRLRLLGVALSAGYAAAMADIGLRRVVPGANDNATGVAALLSIAPLLAAEAPSRLRVKLVFTGSEEPILDGMKAFARRHFAELPRDRTRFVCVDTVGSPHLLLLEGEGMLGIGEYDKPLLRLLRSCADELGVFVFPELRFRNATDGVVAMNAGYPAAMLGSADRFKIPTDYHWPTDTADRVDYGTVAEAARVLARALERLDRGEADAAESPGDASAAYL